MGWFSPSRTSAPTTGAAEGAAAIEKTPAMSTSSTTAAPTAASAPQSTEKLTYTEAEQLDQLIGGARLDDAAAHDKAAFLRSNRRHMYVDGFLSCAAYTFSGLQHIHGQSNALTLLTMWTVGTTFLVDAGERRYLSDVLQGTLPTMQKGGKTATSEDTADDKSSTPVIANVSPVTASTPPLDAAKIAEQQRKIFLTQAVASWVWMLASFQQFKVHKRLKWCGYSSWMGLGCVGYYTTRHMYNLLVE